MYRNNLHGVLQYDLIIYLMLSKTYLLEIIFNFIKLFKDQTFFHLLLLYHL